MTPDHQAHTRRCRCGKKLPDAAPIGGPVHLCGPDKAWAGDNTPPECLNCGRKHRGDCDACPECGSRHGPDQQCRSRGQVASGPMHKACNRYANASIMVASLLDGHASPTTVRAGGMTKSRSPGPPDPTQEQALDQLERVDHVMHVWAHLYGPCRSCPDVDSPHDEQRSLSQHVATDLELVDNVAGRSVISGGVAKWIGRLNVAQQDAADRVLAGWLDDYRGVDGPAAEPDELRSRVSDMRLLAGRVERLVRMLGWESPIVSREDAA